MAESKIIIVQKELSRCGWNYHRNDESEKKNIRSTKIKRTKEKYVTLNSLNDIVKNAATDIKKSNQAHVFIRHSSKLYSDQIGKFQCTARSGNQHLMIIYIVDANVVLAEPFKNKTSRKLTDAYLKLKKEIDKRRFTIDMHILDKE